MPLDSNVTSRAKAVITSDEEGRIIASAAEGPWTSVTIRSRWSHWQAGFAPGESWLLQFVRYLRAAGERASQIESLTIEGSLDGGAEGAVGNESRSCRIDAGITAEFTQLCENLRIVAISGMVCVSAGGEVLVRLGAESRSVGYALKTLVLTDVQCEDEGSWQELLLLQPEHRWESVTLKNVGHPRFPASMTLPVASMFVRSLKVCSTTTRSDSGRDTPREVSRCTLYGIEYIHFTAERPAEMAEAEAVLLASAESLRFAGWTLTTPMMAEVVGGVLPALKTCGKLESMVFEIRINARHGRKDMSLGVLLEHWLEYGPKDYKTLGVRIIVEGAGGKADWRKWAERVWEGWRDVGRLLREMPRLEAVFIELPAHAEGEGEKWTWTRDMRESLYKALRWDMPTQEPDSFGTWLLWHERRWARLLEGLRD